MSTAINLVKFVLLLAGSLVYLVGLGWLVVGPLLHGSLINKKKDTLLVNEFPLILLGGFIINFGILLILQTLKISLIVGGVLAIIGVVFFCVYFFRNHFKKVKHPDAVNKWVGIIFFCLILTGPILTKALYDWDARSIWFFHAKMIYAAGSIGLAAGWQDPSVTFSQLDYPQLISSLAAQIMYIMGFWNEYLPKFSLFLVFIPAVSWLVTFARRSFSYIFLIIILPFSLFPWLWNGYMDGLLAFYFCIALLLFERYMKTEQPIDLVSSIACAIFLLYLKNEGDLAALALVFAFIVYYLIKKHPLAAKKKITISWRYVLIGVAALVPFVLWGVYKQQWGLSNDLSLGSDSSFKLLTTRLSDGSLKLILEKIFKYVSASVMLLVLLLISNLLFKRPFIKECLPAIIATSIYVTGMVVIYLVTPHDLVWHLNNSTVRVMELANGGFSIACYMLLDSLEHDPVVIEPKPVKQF